MYARNITNKTYSNTTSNRNFDIYLDESSIDAIIEIGKHALLPVTTVGPWMSSGAGRAWNSHIAWITLAPWRARRTRRPLGPLNAGWSSSTRRSGGSLNSRDTWDSGCTATAVAIFTVSIWRFYGRPLKLKKAKKISKQILRWIKVVIFFWNMILKFTILLVALPPPTSRKSVFRRGGRYAYINLPVLQGFVVAQSPAAETQQQG